MAVAYKLIEQDENGVITTKGAAADVDKAWNKLARWAREHPQSEFFAIDAEQRKVVFGITLSAGYAREVVRGDSQAEVDSTATVASLRLAS